MKFEEIKIGDSYTLTKTITEEQIQLFADFSGDFNPVHMDDDFCQGHGLQSRIVHGMLMLSFLSALIGMHLPGDGAVWMSQNIDFLKPARIGDTIHITGEVTDRSDSNSLGLKNMRLRIKILNQYDHVLVRGYVKVALK